MKRRIGQSGMSLPEIMVALAISSVVAAVIFNMFSSQNMIYTGERVKTHNTSNTRLVLDAISRKIRQIGFDPEETGNSTFHLKDSTGSFTTTAMTSNTSLFYTMDFDEDGTLDDNANEYVGIQWDSTNSTVQYAEVSSGAVTGWKDKYSQVVDFDLEYVYEDGTSSSGTTDLPSDSVTDKTYDDVRAVVLTITTRSDEKYYRAGNYLEETVSSTILLRNNTSDDK